MVKFGKNKFKTLNKLAKKQNDCPTSNKVIKKKINAEKKVSFQKEVLLKQAFKSDGLVRNLRSTKALQDKTKEPERHKPKQEGQATKIKIKSVEKQKKRQKTQINDTKLLISLMKKK